VATKVLLIWGDYAPGSHFAAMAVSYSEGAVSSVRAWSIWSNA
jgi:hypothetical protein